MSIIGFLYALGVFGTILLSVFMILFVILSIGDEVEPEYESWISNEDIPKGE